MTTLLIAALAFKITGSTNATITPGSVQTKDGKRTYLLAQPKAFRSSPRPLIILLHGHTGSASQTLGQGRSASPMAEWLTIADREGLIMAALDGSPGGDGRRGWNDGRPDAPGNPKTDDVAFVQVVIDKLEKEDQVDPKRVFLMGMSNGGIMCFRLALELKSPIAGFAAICSSMPPGLLERRPSHKISTLLIDGTADPLVPYGGGQVQFFGYRRGAVASIDASLNFWLKADGLTGRPGETAIPGSGPTHARTYQYGKGNPQVELIKIEGGGHVEPSKTHNLGPLYLRLVGKQNHDLETAEVAWAFFRDKRS
jgi:polyhydroxybutyrate depolymerase